MRVSLGSGGILFQAPDQEDLTKGVNTYPPKTVKLTYDS